MRWRRVCRAAALPLAFLVAHPDPARALPAETLKSVVSVLPVWPGRAQGGGGRPGVAPEGSGVVLRPGIVATAWHVVKPARRIDIRLSDGRILPARLIAGDEASDIAVLGVDAASAPVAIAPAPRLAQPVCAIGNAFGLGLSVTCGVVSALDVTDAGFNPVEDFVQTDAASNPGSSGGALVDADGRLVGMMSAIFASKGDTDIGVNFAVSTALLLRVVDALVADGAVRYPSPGWALRAAPRHRLARLAAPVVRTVEPDGPAARAGIAPGDSVLEIGARRVRTPRDAIAAVAVIRDPGEPVDVTVERGGHRRSVALRLGAAPKPPAPRKRPQARGDCPHPAPVCRARQAVFPVSGFDPAASATRIGRTLLVTNRHVVADRPDALVHTPDGPRQARVVPSAYRGDLALLEVEGLPEGSIPDLEGELSDGAFYAIGADIARKQVRVFAPGGLIARPAEGAELGRLHVRARMQPGVSGGALVDRNGALVGIAVGGGEGRFEAIPLAGLRALLALRAHANAARVTRRLGRAFADCAARMDGFRPRAAQEPARDALSKACAAAMNHGQLLEAGRLLARARGFDGAIALLGQAVRQVPNSINARLSLLVALQLAGRFAEMTGHARRAMTMAPEDPQALRFAIQSGVWGNAPALAEAAYRALLEVDPRQARAARRFIDNAPPAPRRR
ncbi:MAG: trypsin-like peptidase domain-containing protein [Defluviicoccus sp.]|nr:trypsin-like peptidase domain-containing protein [Defluviicoccus sp.]